MTVEHPLLDLTLFKNPAFTRANIAGFFSGAAFLSLVVILPLFIVEVVGVTATEAGISLIPFSLGIAFGATSAGQLASRTGHYRAILSPVARCCLVACSCSPEWTKPCRMLL